jgi:hypothetical protein
VVVDNLEDEDWVLVELIKKLRQALEQADHIKLERLSKIFGPEYLELALITLEVDPTKVSTETLWQIGFETASKKITDGRGYSPLKLATNEAISVANKVVLIGKGSRDPQGILLSLMGRMSDGSRSSSEQEVEVNYEDQGQLPEPKAKKLSVKKKPSDAI